VTADKIEVFAVLFLSTQGQFRKNVSTKSNNIQFIENELQLNSEQVKKVKEMRIEHFETASKLQDGIGELKKELFDELFFDDPNKIKANEIADRIGAKHTQLEKLAFNHFLEMKELCEIDQRKKLENLLNDFFKNTRKPPNPR